MTSVNTHFTFNYSQPVEYRFSHDSVFLARQSFELTSHMSLGGKRGLDIGAGSGIVGLDYLCHRKNENFDLPQSFDFLEIQDVYSQHFEKNKLNSQLTETQLNFLNRNYEDLLLPEFGGKYDLILANPPYFFKEHGLMSPSEFKNRCRFFIDSDFASLLLGIASALTPRGEAFILLRDLTQHGWNSIEEAHKICGDRLDIKKVGEIRGTLFVSLKLIS